MFTCSFMAKHVNVLVINPPNKGFFILRFSYFVVLFIYGFKA
jgi:hypothetical protein